MGPWTVHQMTWVWVLLPTAHWLVNLISGAVKWDNYSPPLSPPDSLSLEFPGPSVVLAQMAASICVSVSALGQDAQTLWLLHAGWCQDTAGLTSLSVPESKRQLAQWMSWGVTYEGTGVQCWVTVDKLLKCSHASVSSSVKWLS